jgi:type II secretory ATPase GspE/PulE/Tfp pilus assembly ATPase PilB-like protein
MTTSVSTVVSEMAPRFVRLFSMAGLLTQAEIERYSEAHGRQKSFVDILNQEVSVETFVDFFKYEIPLPFTKKRSLELENQLQAAVIRGDDLRQLLTIHRPPVDTIVQHMVVTKAATAANMQAALERAARMNEDPYDRLFREDLVSPETLSKFVRSPANPLARRCALAMALPILEHNGLLAEQAADEIISKLNTMSTPEAAAAVQKAMKISQAELIDKIESGLYFVEATITPGENDEELLKQFPPGFIGHQLFIPLFTNENRIGIAASDPLNLDLAIVIRLITSKWLVASFAPSGVIVDWINQAFGGERYLAVPAQAAVVSAPQVEPTVPEAPRLEKAPEPKAEREPAPAPTPAAAPKPKSAPTAPKKPALLRPGEAPTDNLSAVQLVSSLIENGIDLRATDVHLEPSRTQMNVRFRIDGQLTKILTLPANLISPVTSRIKVLANMDVTERRRPQDGHIMLNLENRHFDFRIATMPTIFGEKVAIRILDSQRVMRGLKDIGLNPKQEKVAERLIKHPFGIIIVTGPTGSGKTSTLYAALNELNKENRHLVTIEDPVEYQLDGITQVQVDPHIGLTFSDGLRATLRQDPDIIMVGEIRDPDTAKIAVRAALTGHLVFSTLHTNSAIGGFQALEHLGVSPFMIGSAVVGMIGQRLVRKLCDNCKKAKPLTKALAEQLGLTYNTKLRMHRAVGCEQCLSTGYSGRLGIFEILEVTEAMRKGILGEETPDRLLEIARGEDFISMREMGLEKVKAGVTSPEELVEKVMLDS